jgi:sodium/hydrogen antiporter
VAVIGLTVFLSVLAHGLTATPLATLYGHVATANRPEPGEPEPDLPVRGLPRRLDTAAHHTTHAKSN